MIYLFLKIFFTGNIVLKCHELRAVMMEKSVI